MAKMTPFQRLNKRGIIVVEVDGVLARMTQKGSLAIQVAPDVERHIAEDRLRAAALLAASIRRRVSEDGDLAGQSPSRTGRRKVYLSPAFIGRTTLEKKNDYGSIYRNTAAMYAALGRRPETYRASGGMWSGLQARTVGLGYTDFIIDFAGTSEGRGKPILVRRQSGRGKVLVAIRSERVRNQTKGGAIYQQQGVNVLLPTQREADTMAARVISGIGVRFADVFG